MAEFEPRRDPVEWPEKSGKPGSKSRRKAKEPGGGSIINTGYVFLRGSDMNQDGTAPNTTYGSAPNAVVGKALADAATNGVLGAVIMPTDCAPGSNLDVSIYWIAATTSAGSESVRWQVDIRVTSDSELPASGVASGTSTTTFTDSAEAHTANFIYKSGRNAMDTVNPGSLVRINVRRLGADAADTYNNTVAVWMVRLRYTRAAA